jgi:uncharacterized membrane protein YeaQ/YmgE (transglycosylase-associated protein family)
MTETDITTLSTSIVGAVSPFLTQVIREKWIKVNGNKAQWLSLVVAGACVVAAHVSVFLSTHKAPDPTQVLTSGALAFSLSQVVYRNFGLKKKPDENGEG